jgi:hypothetical protein
MILRAARIVAPLLLAATPVLAQDPAGPDFQVNTYTTGAQTEPDVAASGAGFVVVWESWGSPGDDDDGPSIQAQRFSPEGAPAGPQFQVNVDTLGQQRAPRVAARHTDGGFLVVWMDRPPAGDWDLRARLYEATGVPLGAPFQVNSYATDDQFSPDVAARPNGTFVVVWASEGSYGTDTLGTSIQGRRIGAAGLPFGTEFQVNNTTNRGQDAPAVAVAADGGFVVVWNGGTLSESLEARRFDVSATPEGPQFRVNNGGTPRLIHTAVAVGPDDGFLAGYVENFFQGFSFAHVNAFGPDDEFLGGFAVDVNDYYGGRYIQAETDPFGEFIVAWNGSGNIKARKVSAGGLPTADEIVVPCCATSTQHRPRVTFDPAGGMVVVWRTFGSPGTDPDTAILGRRFLGTLIFEDGFESGDASAWSSTVP